MKGGYYNAIPVYRLGFWLKTKKVPVLPRIIEGLIYILFNCTIPLSAKIGKGTYCSHRGMAVVIHKNSIIGDNCIIGTSVVLGGRHEKNPGGPILGNNVYIGTGAKIIGPVKIGNNCKIGANAVVMIDMPDNSTAVGIPAKIVNS